MKNTLGKVCLMSGLVIFSLSGCYGGGSMLICQRPSRPRPHYMVHRTPPPPRHHHMTPIVHHHSSPSPSFRPNSGGHGGNAGHGGHGASQAPRK